MTDAPSAAPGVALWQAALRWQREAGAALRPLGLTHAQYVVLACAWWLGAEGHGTPTQRRLAEHAGTDPMMTSQVLRVLEGRGLVARERDATDARARRVRVTPAGAELAARARAVVDDVDARLFAGAPAAAPAALRRLARGVH